MTPVFLQLSALGVGRPWCVARCVPMVRQKGLSMGLWRRSMWNKSGTCLCSIGWPCSSTITPRRNWLKHSIPETPIFIYWAIEEDETKLWVVQNVHKICRYMTQPFIRFVHTPSECTSNIWMLQAYVYQVYKYIKQTSIKYMNTPSKRTSNM